MTDATATQAEDAIRFFFDAQGETPDEFEIEEAISEIGNPDATLRIVETAETADNYRSAGFTDEAAGWAKEYIDAGLAVLTKIVGRRSTPRGWVNTEVTVIIADLGDKRLVCTMPV